jgi:aryl-alcohol dehydrogenase-like predicted oxidoreductase
MQYRQLGRAGLRVSALGLGAMTFGESTTFMKGVTSSTDEAHAVLDRAIDAGVNLIDTANVYSEGRSEELLGSWLGSSRRADLVLATKCRMPTGPGPNDRGLGRRHVIASCEASLRRLRTDWIDLYQVHMQDRSAPIEETLRALDDLTTAGKIRYAGCSNYTGYRLVESLWAADRRDTIRYESLQLQWSLLVRDAERELVPAARAFGLGLLVWAPLARGFLSGKYERGAPAPVGARLESWQDTWRALDQPRSWTILDGLRAVAARRGASPAAVALAWLLGKPEVSSLLVGARTPAQLDVNLAAADLALAPEEMAELDALSDPEWGYPYTFIGRREPW